MADDLYPFKLVYDDGTERLACDSARDRGELGAVRMVEFNRGFN